VDDKSSDSYEKLIDRLLASKAYGERWADVADVVRYADTTGGGGDYPSASLQVSRLRDPGFPG